MLTFGLICALVATASAGNISNDNLFLNVLR